VFIKGQWANTTHQNILYHQILTDGSAGFNERKAIKLILLRGWNDDSSFLEHTEEPTKTFSSIELQSHSLDFSSSLGLVLGFLSSFLAKQSTTFIENPPSKLLFLHL
jgi:hypothetical protein